MDIFGGTPLSGGNVGLITETHAAIDIGFSANSLDEMLVDLHDAQRKYQHAGPHKANLARQRVIQNVADIVQMDVTDREKDTVASILLTLVRQAERDLRESLSERLCVMENVPEQVALFLAHDEISIAKPVLQYSPILTETDLLYIIKSKGNEYWQAIAMRKMLDYGVVDALVETKDEETAFNLLHNENAQLGITALETFAELSKYSNKIADPLLAREELPKRLAMKLYWHVSQAMRDQIITRFEMPKEQLDSALQDALQDFSDTAEGVANPRPSSLMTDVARKYKKLGRLTDSILIKTLQRGQLRFFVAMMSERSGLDAETLNEVMRQIGGQGMAVLCKAIGCSKESFVSLFLLTRSMCRCERNVDAVELRKAIRYFDTLTEQMAARILAASKK